jgi:hypothetical protein
MIIFIEFFFLIHGKFLFKNNDYRKIIYFHKKNEINKQTSEGVLVVLPFLI